MASSGGIGQTGFLAVSLLNHALVNALGEELLLQGRNPTVSSR